MLPLGTYLYVDGADFCALAKHRPARHRILRARCLTLKQIDCVLTLDYASGCCTKITDSNQTLDFDEVRMPRLLSVNVGLPRDVTWNGKTVRTAIWKSPVEGRRMVRKLNIDGDAQADLAGHGGEQRAVFVYQMDSYHYWERFLGPQ